MTKKRSQRTERPVPPTTTYAEWRARAAALLVRQGVLSAYARATVAAILHHRRHAAGCGGERAQVLYNTHARPSNAGDDRRIPFKVVRSNGTDEILALAINLLFLWNLSGGGQDVPGGPDRVR
jgi:hypothetical protein